MNVGLNIMLALAYTCGCW